MTYKKILLALDMNDKGSVLFEEALGFARAAGAELALLCCIEEETAAEADERVATTSELNLTDSQRALDRQRTERLGHVRAWLDSLARSASESGVSTRVDAEEGDPARRICEMAQHWGADLIVLGHSGRHPVRELFLGDINRHVVRCAPCAVLITKRV